MARKRDSKPKSVAAQSPSLVGRGQGEGFSTGSVPSLVGRGQGEGFSTGSVPSLVGRGQGRVEPSAQRRPSALLDTRVIYCGDCLDQLQRLPDACIDLIYIDPPFNSNRNYEVFWGETKEKRAFADRHASTAAYIDFMRPRCVELARVLRKTGSFHYHCDWHHRHGNGRRTLGTD
jgi:hypothetical protein